MTRELIHRRQITIHEALIRNQIIISEKIDQPKCDIEKYYCDLQKFKEKVMTIEQILIDLDSTDFELQFQLDCNLAFEYLQNLRTSYSPKRAIAQYTMHYIQNLEVVLQNKIKLFHLKQQHG